jgi:hypothetical protein
MKSLISSVDNAKAKSAIVRKELFLKIVLQNLNIVYTTQSITCTLSSSATKEPSGVKNLRSSPGKDGQDYSPYTIPLNASAKTFTQWKLQNVVDRQRQVYEIEE